MNPLLNRKKLKAPKVQLGLFNLVILALFCLFIGTAAKRGGDSSPTEDPPGSALPPIASDTPLTVEPTMPEGFDEMSTTCQEKVFPITSGGSQDEWVSCTIYDPVNEYIIVGGNTTSDDYA